MRKYCKAYHLKDFRQFSGWAEKREEGEPELSDDTICYLWDDFIVVRSPIQDQGVIFDTITPEWQDFCATVLHFTIPEDLQYAYQQVDGSISAEPTQEGSASA
jgi:hypothetical protein